MKKFENVLRSMTFDFFGEGKHKIAPSNFLAEKNAVFLDVRSDHEVKALAFDLGYYFQMLHIPVGEIPERISEVPRDKFVGIFCSAGVRSAMVYFYLMGLGYDNVKIIEGGYAEFVEELKPGKLLKRSRSKGM